MPSPILDKTQKEINTILKREGYYTFTANEYINNPQAIKLLQLYTASTKPSSLKMLNVYHYITTSLGNKKIRYSAITLDNSIDYLVIKSLFGLSNHSLIQSIMDPAYTNAVSQNEDGMIEFDWRLQAKVDSWMQECKTINRCFAQLRADKKKWQADKTQYIKYWKEVSKASLFNELSIVNDYVTFIKQSPGLNQKVTFKAKALIKKGLPNITTIKIAKEIARNSSFFYLQKYI